MKPRQFNVAQRVLLVVALGIAFYFLGNWVTNLGAHPLTGWTGYAPLQTNSLFERFGGLHAGVRLVLWLLFIFVWTVLSLWLLQSPREKDRA